MRVSVFTRVHASLCVCARAARARARVCVCVNTSTANRLSTHFSSSHDRVLWVVSGPCVAYLPVLLCCAAFAYINKVLF